MNRKVEFIESYIKVGNDYQWNDNHGELIRCKDCKWYKRDHNGGCLCETGGGLYNSQPEDYCSRAERKEK